MNFAFYDTETTGTDTTSDQVLQFAAVLTDADLNKLDRLETGRRYTPPHPPHYPKGQWPSISVGGIIGGTVMEIYK